MTIEKVGWRFNVWKKLIERLGPNGAKLPNSIQSGLAKLGQKLLQKDQEGK